MSRVIKRTLEILSGLALLWQFVFRIFDWLTRFDFVLEQVAKHGWVADVIEAIINHPPPYGLLTTFFMGLILAAVIVWDRRGRKLAAPTRQIAQIGSLNHPLTSTGIESKIALSFQESRAIVHDPHNYLKFHWMCYVTNIGSEALKRCHIKLRLDDLKGSHIVCVPFDLPPLDEEMVGFLFTVAYKDDERPEEALITHYFYAGTELRNHPAAILIPVGDHILELTAYADNSIPTSIKLHMSNELGHWKIRCA